MIEAGGELGHAGAGTVGVGPRLASRLAWLRSFVRVAAGVHAIAALDGIRGLAATLVFIVHYQAAFGPLLWAHRTASLAGNYAAEMGYHGVNLFFVLSGFLIYGSLVGRPVALRTYLWRRVRRIYPTFLVVLVLYLTVGRAVLGIEKLPEQGALVYMLQNALLLPGVFPIKPVVIVAWSLSYEIFFYLGIAALVLGLGMRRWQAHQRVAFFVALTIVWAVSGTVAQRSVGSFVMFVPGILLWELSRSPRADTVRARTPSWLVWAALASAILVAPSLQRPFAADRLIRLGITPAIGVFLMLALTIPVLVLHALGRRGAVVRALSWEPLRAVGVVSYSFYLIHGATINVLALAFWRVLGPRPAFGGTLYLLLLPVVYGAAVLTSLVLFRAVEERLSL